MNIHNVSKYAFYDFAEEFIGYPLKGSGKIVKFSNLDKEIILTIKRYHQRQCDMHEFVFADTYCIHKTNYWNSTDITALWEEFYSRTQQHEL